MNRFKILRGILSPALEFYKPDPKDSVKIRILGEQWEKQLEVKNIEQAQRIAADADLITNIVHKRPGSPLSSLFRPLPSELCPVCNGWGNLISNDGHGGSIECYKCHGTGYL